MCNNDVLTMFRKCLLAALSLIVMCSIYRVTHVGVSFTPLKCASGIERDCGSSTYYPYLLNAIRSPVLLFPHIYTKEGSGDGQPVIQKRALWWMILMLCPYFKFNRSNVVCLLQSQNSISHLMDVTWEAVDFLIEDLRVVQLCTAPAVLKI